MANVGGFLQALGEMFHGVGQDQQANFTRQLALRNANREDLNSESERKLRQAQQLVAEHEAKKLQPGDPGYTQSVQDESAARAMGALPAETQLAVARGQIDLQNALQEEAARGNNAAKIALIQQGGENTRQAKQQTFTHGENIDERNFQAAQEAARLAGTGENQQVLERQKQSGEMFPLIAGAFGQGPLANQPPSPPAYGATPPPMASAVAPSSSSKSKPKLSQAEYNAGRAKHTDAEIASHYDLTGITRQ